MILIDYSPMLISCAHSANTAVNKQGDIDGLTENYAQHLNFLDGKGFKEIHMFRMLNSLRMVRKAYRGKYGQTVLAVDRKPYWRSEKFPNYKKNRKPMKQDIDWSTAFANGEEILEHAESVFGYKRMDAIGLEGDDIIGVLVENFPNERHVIISPDGDYKQLLKYENVEQYDLIRKRKITCRDSDKFLRGKIIGGDKKDGIPNILSDIDTFVTENTRQASIKRRDLESWVNCVNPLMFCDGAMLERYEFNKDLLDMLNVPQDRKDQIMNMANREMPKRKTSLYSWFAQKGMVRFIEQVGDFA